MRFESKCRLIPWIQCHIQETGTSLRGFFRKNRLFMETVNAVFYLRGEISTSRQWVHSHLKIRLAELGMGGVAGDELLHEALVGGLGEPTLLVHQRHNPHRLKRKTQVYT